MTTTGPRGGIQNCGRRPDYRLERHSGQWPLRQRSASHLPSRTRQHWRQPVATPRTQDAPDWLRIRRASAMPVRRLQTRVGNGVQAGWVPGRPEERRIRLPQHPALGGDQPRQRRNASARGHSSLGPPDPECFRSLLHPVEEQTRDALRRATEYTAKQRQQPRTVVPLGPRRSSAS
jgi:hypothetical protein